MQKIYLLISAFICLLFGYVHAQEKSSESWQNNPAVLKNARVDALLKSHKHISKIQQKSIIPVPDKTAYGFLMDSNETPENMGMIAFQLPKPDIYSTIMSGTMEDAVWSGFFIEDTYYAIMVSISVSGFSTPTNLVTIDLKTGQKTVVCDLSHLKNAGPDGLTALLFSDMTYDYSTSTVYAIANTGLFQSSIYKFSQTDGSVTVISPLDIESYIVSLACSYDGQLYGIATGGILYKINKENGKTTLIGDTGYMPWYVQSMDFDHTDNQLYWAGTDAEHTFMARVDTKTAETYEMGTFVANSQILGLHIPFTRVARGGPDKVTELEVVPEQKGGLSATLSWTNPISDPFGNKLTGKMGIKIYCNNILVTDIKDKNPGEKCSYTDKSIKAKGMYSYRIVPYNTASDGTLSKLQIWIGEDAPCLPENVATKVNGDQVDIKWEISSVGVHGGWVNPVKMKYTVIRLPDNAVITSNISELTCIDKNITKLSKWKYKIVVTDIDGNNAEFVTRSIAVGPGLQSYIQDFQSDNSFELWDIYNMNNDDRTWNLEMRDNDKCALYRYNPHLSADDWLVTPPLKLEAQKRYRISFDKKTYHNTMGMYSEKLKVCIGNSPQPQYQSIELADITIENKPWETIEREFTPDQSSNYYVGFYIYSDKDRGFVGLDNFKIEEVFFNDLQSIKVQGPESAVVGQISEYEVTIRNKGSQPAISYKVGLADENGNVLGELMNIDEMINPGEYKTFKIKWIPIDINQQKVCAIVKLTADSDESNNLSNFIIVNTQDPMATRIITLGEKSSTNTAPFQFDSPAEIPTAQTIYLASEINSPNGLISSLKWYPNFYEMETKSEPVEIYLANTTETSLKTSYLDFSSFTLVYAGNVKVEKNQAELEIKLNEMFFYSGGNLCICVKRLTSKVTYSWRDGFYSYSTLGYDAPTRTHFFDDRYSQWKPMVSIGLNSAGAKFSGKVTSEGQPMKGVMVLVEESGQGVKSDEEGNYSFDLINLGNYHISYNIFGYFKEVKETAITGTDPVIQDISLNKIPLVKVSGSVKNNLNLPLENTKILFEGYHNYEVLTDADGIFSIANVYADGNYSLTIQSTNYSVYQKEIDMKVQTDQNLETSILTEIPYPVYGLSSKESVLKWQEPVQQMECRNDDGTISGTAGFIPQAASNKGLFGQVYRVPGKITSVKWYIASMNGVMKKKVNLFIMKVDESGTATTEPLFIKEDILSTCDEWFEYVLNIPIEATNGFLVGIGSSTESVNLGVDTGSDKNYPFVREDNLLVSDYEDFNYTTSVYGGNFMIRANYISMLPARLPHFGLIDSYNVYRMKQGNESKKDNWKLLSKVDKLTYTDTSLANAEQGYYKYAVSVNWKVAGESQALISETVAKDMNTNVSMRITSNVKDRKAILDTEVTLASEDGQYKFVSRLKNEDGRISFDRIPKGIYSVSISQPRFDLFKKSKVDLSKNPDYNIGDYQLTERLVAPVNVSLNNLDEGSNQYRLIWNLTSSIFEDFESHTDFELNSPGSHGWQYFDGDKSKQTYGIQNVSYPNNGKGTAYIIFNPSGTKPRLDADPEICAWSGDKYQASFSAANGANDDYFISPELFFNDDFNFSFYARAFTDSYGMERINVGYSKSDTEPESFIWLVQAEYLNIPASWKQYSYTVPAEARYVAIRCVSDNAFLFMMDDVQIGSETPQNFKTYAKSYKVYLDGKCLASLNTNTYDLTIPGNESHTVGVEAIYETGLSEMSTVKVNMGTSISDENSDNWSLVYSGGKLLFDGEVESIMVYSPTGVSVASFANAACSVSVSSLPKGIYMVVAEMNGMRLIKKVIIR